MLNVGPMVNRYFSLRRHRLPQIADQKNFRSHGQSVKTVASHAAMTGSTPVGTTTCRTSKFGCGRRWSTKI